MQGDAVQVMAIYSKSGPKNVTNIAMFESSNKSIVMVENGYLKSGTRAGTATVTAYYNGLKAICNVKVEILEDVKLRVLEVKPSSQTITEFDKLGQKLQVIATYDNSTIDVTDKATFTTGNSSIAYEYKGYIKSGSEEGTTLITASYKGLTAICIVTVDMTEEVGTQSLNLGKSTGFTIPEDLPVLGGMDLSFGLDFIPASVSMSKSEFKIAIGASDTASVGEKWESFKKTFESAKGNINSARRLSSAMKAFGGKSGKFSIMKGWEPSLDVYGYIEGTVVDGTPIVNKGSIVLLAEAKYTNQTQFFIGPVPVCFEIGGGVKLESMSGIMRYVPNTGNLKLNSELVITPSFELGGGIGVAKVVTIGGTGEAELEFLMRSRDDYLKISLTGSLNVKATALFFEAKKKIAKGTWTLYESSSGVRTMQSPQFSANPDIYNSNEYSIMSRDYINKPSEWIGSKPMLRTMANGYTNTDMKVLGTNIYPNAQPQLVNIGDRQIMVWVADNPDRMSSNRTMLVYSVYDKSGDVWSTPKAVDDDGTADFYPQLAQDGNDLYVVWQNSNKSFDDGTTLEEVAGSGEIAVSKFDTVSNNFGPAVRLTTNNTVDTLPQITAAHNKVYIAWIGNSKNDIFGEKGKNSVYYSELKDNQWTSPALLCDNLNAVPSLSAGFIGNSYTVAYVLDGDNVLDTINDREIYVVGPDIESKRLTNNDTIDSAPVFSSFNGTDAMYWYNEGNILYLTGFEKGPSRVFGESNQGLKDEFKVLCNNLGKTAVIWADTTDGATEIYAAIFDTSKKEWGEPVKISHIGSRIQSPGGVLDDKGNYNIVFSKLTQLEDGNEQSDLCIMKVIPSYDLTVDDVTFDDKKVIPGTELPIDVDVVNNGEIGIEEAVIDILDGNEIINSSVRQVGLKSGESKTITVLMNLPESITKKTYKVRVTCIRGDEYNISDNTKEFDVGYTDISLVLERHSEGNIEDIVAHIRNLSHVATGAELKVRKGSEDGDIIDTKTISNITYGDNVEYSYQFNKSILCDGKDSETLYFSVEAKEEELYTSDNSSFKVIKGDKTTTIAGYVSVDFQYSETAEAKIKSGFKVKISGTDLFAVTDENGHFSIPVVSGNTEGYSLEITKPGYLKRNLHITEPEKLEAVTKDTPITLWAGDFEINGLQNYAINIEDIMEMAKAFNCAANDSRYIAQFDINKDNAINIVDIMIVAKHFNSITSGYIAN